MDHLLTAADAARILNVVPATVRAMALSGRLPVAATTEGGIRLFRREDVEQLARERVVQQEDDAVRPVPAAKEGGR